MSKHDFERGDIGVPYCQLISFLDELDKTPARLITRVEEPDELLEEDLSSDLPEETLLLIDSFATLDGQSQEMVVELVKVLLEREGGKKQD